MNEQDGYNSDDYPNDYSDPNAVAGQFAGIEDRLADLEREIAENTAKKSTAVSGFWLFGSALAITLSWSRNASILYCIGHGMASWIYVIYFAVTR